MQRPSLIATQAGTIQLNLVLQLSVHPATGMEAARRRAWSYGRLLLAGIICMLLPAAAFVPPSLTSGWNRPSLSTPQRPCLSRLGLQQLPPAIKKQRPERVSSPGSDSNGECVVEFPLPLGYRLGMLDPSDLPTVTTLLLCCFPVPLPDVPSILNYSPERRPGLLDRLIALPYGRLVTWASLTLARFQIRSGLMSRMGERLWVGSWACPSLDSVVLAVQEDATQAIVAVVELCLSRPDGNLLPSYRRQPNKRWEETHRPYLCNLAVLPAYRGQGLGKALVRACEAVARDVWGYEELYLHLDASDPTATTLYNALGYAEVHDPDLRPTGWLQRVMQQAISKDGAPLQYHVKRLHAPSLSPSNAHRASSAQHRQQQQGGGVAITGLAQQQP